MFVAYRIRIRSGVYNDSLNISAGVEVWGWRVQGVIAEGHSYTSQGPATGVMYGSVLCEGPATGVMYGSILWLMQWRVCRSRVRRGPF